MKEVYGTFLFDGTNHFLALKKSRNRCEVEPERKTLRQHHRSTQFFLGSLLVFLSKYTVSVGRFLVNSRLHIQLAMQRSSLFQSHSRAR